MNKLIQEMLSALQMLSNGLPPFSQTLRAWTTLRVAHISTATTAASKSSVKLMGRTNGSSSA
jgi:hypothetical protein